MRHKRYIFLFILTVSVSLLVIGCVYNVISGKPWYANIMVQFFLNLPLCIGLGFIDFGVINLIYKRLKQRNNAVRILVVSTIPSAYTYSSCCCSVFCDFMFREANLKRDKNGTKPQENKVRNTIELHAPTVGITLSCTKVQICPVKSEQFYLFLSLTNTFSDYCTTRDNTSTFYIPVYPFSEYVYVKQCFHSFGQ